MRCLEVLGTELGADNYQSLLFSFRILGRKWLELLELRRVYSTCRPPNPTSDVLTSELWVDRAWDSATIIRALGLSVGGCS